MKSNFVISKTLDNNKVFIIDNSKLERRLDPSWYCYLRSIEQFKCKKVLLKNLLLKNPQYGANESGIERKHIDEPRYIRITDINDFGELDKDIGKTASKIEEKYFVEKNDLLLARSGNTVGKSYLHKDVGYQCFFAGYMIRFKIDESKALPDYVFTFTQTKIYKNWINAIQRTTGQPNINAEEYKNLEIPLPSIEIQKKIADTYFGFLRQKKQNEAEAEKLLASIDDYLMAELGINFPKQPDNNLKNRMFFTSLNNISGDRFDPFYHKIDFIKTIEQIKKGKFKACPFKNIILDLKNGVEIRDYVDDGIRYMRVTDLGKNGINNSSKKFIAHQEIPEKIKLNDDCILISRSGSLGLVNVVENDIKNSILSSHIFKVELMTDKVYTKYLEAYFRSSLGQLQFFRKNNGGVIPEINQDALKSIIIPLPPLTKQTEIANHISKIRQKAQSLKDHTTIALEKANKEIENILLGNKS